MVTTITITIISTITITIISTIITIILMRSSYYKRANVYSH